MTTSLFICNFYFVLVYNVLAVYVPLNITAFSMPQLRMEKEIIFRQEEEGKPHDVSPPHTTTTTTTESHPPPDCVCSKIYDPVCASNEKSYYNVCLMECDLGKGPNVTVLHQGNCIPF